LFSSDELRQHAVKAVCAIKKEGNPGQQVGRHIRDYFPDFDEAMTAQKSGHSVRQLLRVASTPSGQNRVAACRAVLLLVLQTYGVEAYRAVKTWRELARQAALHPEHASRLRSLALELVTVPYDVGTEEGARASIALLVSNLGDMIDELVAVEDILEEWLVDKGPNNVEPGCINSVSILTATAEFPVHVATIASVKGETHLATLVLESCRQRVFDLKSMLPYLCGSSNPANEKNENKLRSLMNIFVAASRPRRLLAFAMHVDRADVKCLDALRAAGWDVKNWA
jgi:hypothetical protein